MQKEKQKTELTEKDVQKFVDLAFGLFLLALCVFVLAILL